MKEKELFMGCHIQETSIAKLLKTTVKQKKIIKHISIITHFSKSPILRKSRAVPVHVHRSGNKTRTFIIIIIIIIIIIMTTLFRHFHKR